MKNSLGNFKNKKKLCLLLLLMPFFVSSQILIQGSPGSLYGKADKVLPNTAFDKTRNISTEAVSRITPAFKMSANRSSIYSIVTIGESQYDLQTNASIARRVMVYPDGKKAAVWTTSVDDSPYLTRGTGYNRFNGISWLPAVSSRIETGRAGWPNIGSIKISGVNVEYVVSHYSPSSGTMPSGGIYLNINDAIGSSNWTQSFMDQGTGPIWYRTAENSKYIYVIGNYSDTNKYINNVRMPLVYSRYNIANNNWEVKNQILAGYDTGIYKTGVGDVYSIDAKDSIVAILIAPNLQKVTLWKSTDWGKTFTKTIIDSLIIATPKFVGDTVWFYYSDGSCNVVIGNDGYAKCFWSLYKGFKYYGDNLIFYKISDHGIIYYNEKDGLKKIIPTAKVWDRNSNDTLDVENGWKYTRSVNGILYPFTGYGLTNDLLTFPHATVDLSGNIFVIYSAIIEKAFWSIADDGYGVPINENYRDVYVVYSKDDGKTWGPAQNISNNPFMEDVFASVSKNCYGDKLHIIFQEDEDPGTAVLNLDGPTLNKIYYVEVPISDILQNLIGPGDLILLPAPPKPSGIVVLCQNPPDNNYSTSGVAGANSYFWSLTPVTAGVINSSSTYAIVEWNDTFSGIARIKVCGINSNGKGNFSDELQVTINPLLPAPSIPLGNNVLCQNPPDNNYYTSGVTGAYSYSWSLSPAYAGVIYSSTSFATVEWIDTFNGIARIKVRGINNCGNGNFSDELIVTIYPKPSTPTITINGKNLVSSAVLGNQWYDSTGIIPGAISQTYTPLKKGRYYVIVTLNGCRSSVSNSILFDLNNIGEGNNNNTVKIYPNPVSGSLNIESNDYINTTVEILSIEGKLLQSVVLQSSKTQFDIGNYSTGVYMVKIINKESVMVYKLIKQ